MLRCHFETLSKVSTYPAGRAGRASVRPVERGVSADGSCGATSRCFAQISADERGANVLS